MQQITITILTVKFTKLRNGQCYCTRDDEEKKWDEKKVRGDQKVHTTTHKRCYLKTRKTKEIVVDN